MIAGGLVALLCCGGVLVLLAVSGVLAVGQEVVELVFDVLFGGPVSWCGCVVLLVPLLGCCVLAGGAAYVWFTCSTAEAINFCVWFGL